MNNLPHLQAIFEKLKTGYHLSHEDGPLHAALMQDVENNYASYFAAIGMTLVRHHREFFYFEAEERDTESKSLPKVAVFSYILIDHTANQGQPVEDTLMTSTFSLRGLPHFALDSHRALLRQVELHEPDDLRGVVNYLERIGWAKWLGSGSDEFQFLRPFYRMLEKCMELSRLSSERADETVPELSDSTSSNPITEDKHA
jgi:chromosome condensin MukBEF MukE localization factor